MKREKLRLKPLYVLGRLIVYTYALVVTIPLFFAIITAFKTEEERVVNPIGLPKKFYIGNFVTACTEGNLLMAAKNSIIISVGSVGLLLLNVILVSYCLNKIRDTKIGTALYMLILSAMFIPGVGTMTSLMLRRNLGLYNNLFGEIFCNCIGITTGVFLTSGFLRTIPRDLEEAAMLDGASDTQICFKVIVPVIKPVLIAIGILSFTGVWNNALGAMLTLRDPDLYTIPMALLLNFTNEYSVEYTTLFAGVIITSIPLVITYCKCQKYFVSALAGSVKG